MDQYRSVLEVCKFLPYTGVPVAAVVDQCWSSASSSTELWDLYTEEYQFEHCAGGQSSRDSFLQQVIQGKKLPCVSGCEIHIFDCASKTVEVWTYPERVRHVSSACVVLIAAKAVVITWGTSKHGACSLYQKGGQGNLRELVTPRRNHAGIAVKGYLYLFGEQTFRSYVKPTSNFYANAQRFDRGEILPLSLTERLDVSDLSVACTEDWAEVTNMHDVRSSFYVCAEGNCVYLCGGWDSTVCECFHPDSLTFTLIPYRLSSYEITATVLVGTSIVILSQTYATVLDLDTNTGEKTDYTQYEVQLATKPSANLVALRGTVFKPGPHSVTWFHWQSQQMQGQYDAHERRFVDYS